MMKFIILVIHLLLLDPEITSEIKITQKSQGKINTAISKIWEEKEVTPESLPIPKEIDSANKKLFQLMSQSKRLGFLCISSAKGRYDYFDFYVIFNESMEIQKTEILEYRSSHGYQICNKRWLKQFNFLKAGNSLKYRKDIQAISGATVSGNAITEDINKISLLVSKLAETQ